MLSEDELLKLRTVKDVINPRSGEKALKERLTPGAYVQRPRGRIPVRDIDHVPATDDTERLKRKFKQLGRSIRWKLLRK